ncbi:MAG: AAA family ATPase [Verrucomicrobia bacterium]|nr:AAA family ATPase [Verrucomicrobiota bacterium]
MRIASLTLKTFKRFTDLTIAEVPASAKLVLLVGSNGSGKSSVFDAFNLLSGSMGENAPYHRKVPAEQISLEATFHNGGKLAWRDGGLHPSGPSKLQFLGRSSLRVVPEIQRVSDAARQIEHNQDRPPFFTHEDRRFFADVAQFTNQIDRALREPTFAGRQADTLAIFRRYIAPFNDALRRIFGESPATTIQIKNFDNSDPHRPIQLFFAKGRSTVPFDILSHGEKQIVILLMNFAVRRERYEDAIFFIDEMDLHLNTALQKSVMREIVEQWIPDNAQLWTATHALGFIEYADESEHGVIIDFNDLDYDLPQRLVPAPRRHLDVFEIAVPRDSLSRLFSGRKVIACEGNDGALYNAACDDSSRLFVPAGNAEQVFAMVQANPNLWGIRDRDFFLQTEIDLLRKLYPQYRILPFYSIENLLFHPDNIASLNVPGFDAAAWSEAIRAAKDARPLRDVKYARGRIRELRSVPEFQKTHAWDAEPKEIYAAYEAADFDTFYPVVPMKEMPRTFLESFKLSSGDLAKAPWMIQRLKEITS